MPKGGKREGAGRPPLPETRKRLVLYVTDAERQEILHKLTELRKQKPGS